MEIGLVTDTTVERRKARARTGVKNSRAFTDDLGDG
jgi:hypothetical protein